MCRLLEPGHEYPGKAYCREIGYGADNTFILAQRYLELVPFHLLVAAVAAAHKRHLLVGNEVFADFKVFRSYRYLVLEVAFVLVQGVVLVDVLYVRKVARRLV